MPTLGKIPGHNRAARRGAAKEFAKLANKKDWGEWEDIFIEKESKKRGISSLVPEKIKQFWKNNLYTVQAYEVDNLLKLMIRRNDETTSVSWADKQRIKNELVGEEEIAIEVFPPKSKLVNEANIYWLWILPEGNYPFVPQ